MIARAPERSDGLFSIALRTIEEMLPQLLRSEVAEFAIVSDRLPCVKVGADFVPIDNTELPTRAILGMLASVGGEPHLDALGKKPVVWSARVEGVGGVAVSAVMRGDVVQARFRLTKADPRAEAPIRWCRRRCRARRARAPGRLRPSRPPSFAARCSATATSSRWRALQRRPCRRLRPRRRRRRARRCAS